MIIDYSPTRDRFVFSGDPTTIRTLATVPGIYRAGNIMVSRPVPGPVYGVQYLLPGAQITDEAQEVLDDWELWARWRDQQRGRMNGWEDPRLYGFQQGGAFFLLCGSALLADEMGTGKTVQSLSAMNHLNHTANLVVCTASMVEVWAQEAEKWANNLIPIRISGSVARRHKMLLAMEALIALIQTVRDGSAPDSVESALKPGRISVSQDSNSERKTLIIGTRLGNCTASLPKTTIASWRNREGVAPFAEWLIRTASTTGRSDSTSTTATLAEMSGGFSVVRAIAELLLGRKNIQSSCQGVVAITSWGTLPRHTARSTILNRPLSAEQKLPGELSRDWGVLVADEVHKAKDPDAQQTMALMSLRHRAMFRWGLTGTPLVQNPDDLWSIMAFVDPHEWLAGSRSRFRKMYMTGGPGFFGGWNTTGLNPRTEPVLRKFLEPRMIRRTKVEVLHDLPEKLPVQYRPVLMTSKQRTAYNQMVATMLAEVDNGVLVAQGILPRVGYLRMIAAATPNVDDEGKIDHLTTPSSKVDAMLDIIDEMGDRQLVIYADSKMLLDLAMQRTSKQRKNITFTSITGEVANRARKVRIDQFQAGDFQVMFGTTGAGAEGITLTAADTILFLQPPWSNKDLIQSQDRLHRIGQENKVTTLVLYAPHTVDESAIAAVGTKARRLEEVVRDTTSLKSFLEGTLL